jgi:chemotaxis protein MotB
MTPEPSESATPAWAVTFGDLMSLMLVFFVLLNSFATLDARRFAALSQSLQEGFGEPSGAELVWIGAPAGPEAGTPGETAQAEAGVQAAAAAGERVRLALRERRLERVLEVETTPRGVVLRAAATALFEEGSDELRGEALPLLHEVAGVLAALPGDVAVEGHASDPGVAGAASFALSTRRALAALRHLVEVEGLDRRRLSASGFGDVRPLLPDSGPAARARNRRIEFVLRNDGGGDAPRALAELHGPAAQSERKAR